MVCKKDIILKMRTLEKIVVVVNFFFLTSPPFFPLIVYNSLNVVWATDNLKCLSTFDIESAVAMDLLLKDVKM
jgi:hypothetical protein